MARVKRTVRRQRTPLPRAYVNFQEIGQYKTYLQSELPQCWMLQKSESEIAACSPPLHLQTAHVCMDQQRTAAGSIDDSNLQSASTMADRGKHQKSDDQRHLTHHAQLQCSDLTRNAGKSSRNYRKSPTQIQPTNGDTQLPSVLPDDAQETQPTTEPAKRDTESGKDTPIPTLPEHKHRRIRQELHTVGATTPSKKKHNRTTWAKQYRKNIVHQASAQTIHLRRSAQRKHIQLLRLLRQRPSGVGRTTDHVSQHRHVQTDIRRDSDRSTTQIQRSHPDGAHSDPSDN
ncbi:ORF2 [Syngnathus scovelli chapparvovirus]|uniref:ORF2 n=1 Tax=Syngnathus scovelli chapparvovirus TaxID=2662396 RepID=A0A6B9D4G3_9VIRU|nr:ORF2 [Syngnathus scovelli chapparvovirus]QGW62415.1 ORF2 [Syngnathus scovelli chapparvovirus]